MTDFWIAICIVFVLAFIYRAENIPWRDFYKKNIAPLDAEISDATVTLEKIKSRVREAAEKIELYQRNFDHELKEQRAISSDGYVRLDDIKKQKAECISKIKKTKADLNAWHRHSKGTWLGNGGRKIPEFTFLGAFGLEQTVSQKRSLESKRESLSKQIEVLNDQNSSVYEDIVRPAKEKISAIYGDKRALHELHRTGRTKAHFQSEMQSHLEQKAIAEREVVELQAKRSRLIDDFRRKGK